MGLSKKIPWIAWILCHHHGPALKAGSAWQTRSSSSGSFSLFFSFSVRFAGRDGQQSSRSGQHRLLPPPSSQKLHFDSRQSGLMTASLCKSSFTQVAVPMYCLPWASTCWHRRLGLGFSEPIRTRSFWFRAKALTWITPRSRIRSDHYFLAGISAPNIIFSRGSPV